MRLAQRFKSTSNLSTCQGMVWHSEIPVGIHELINKRGSSEKTLTSTSSCRMTLSCKMMDLVYNSVRKPLLQFLNKFDLTNVHQNWGFKSIHKTCSRVELLVLSIYKEYQI